MSRKTLSRFLTVPSIERVWIYTGTDAYGNTPDGAVKMRRKFIGEDDNEIRNNRILPRDDVKFFRTGKGILRLIRFAWTFKQDIRHWEKRASRR
jgi:hypothetical protein